MAGFPVPVGIGASFSNVRTDSVKTSNFTMPEGNAVVTFQPVDLGLPGTATLYDSSDNSIQVMNEGGYYYVQVPQGGLTYYFKATLGANLLAMTIPNNTERWT